MSSLTHFLNPVFSSASAINKSSSYPYPPVFNSYYTIFFTSRYTTTNTFAMAAGLEVAIIIYSMYGHITQLAEAEKRGIEAAGGKATIFQYGFQSYNNSKQTS